MRRLVEAVLALLVLAAPLAGRAAEPAAADSVRTPFARYFATALGGGATGSLAPYLLGSLNHGKTPYAGTALADAGIIRPLSRATRFSYGFGAEGLAGYRKGVDYSRYEADAQAWTVSRFSPPAVWLQQLYGEVKWRGVFLTVGLKEYGPALLNASLSSGDLVESGNARPIPQARIGFVDFQDIPFTNGWVQIQGEVSYGKMVDNAYLKDTYNYYNYHIALNTLYSYKRCFFRSKPSMPLSVTAGMQVGSFFGGKSEFYSNGVLKRVDHYSQSLKTFFKIMFPFGENGEDYYTGQTLGSWDFLARYRLRSGDELRAYFQGPWEDGTGIGRMNGFDGIWGLEYRAARQAWVDGAVVEYLDFRNQSGPIHWEPDDTPGTTVTAHATGRDDYYNNAYYNAWANYGMALGSPYFMAPIYNSDGYPAFLCNRMRGFHIGLSGHPTATLAYRILASYSHGLGTYHAPYHPARDNFSMLFEAEWDAARLLPGLSARAQLGFDAGSLRGDNFGAMVAITYSGIIR